ncbi:cobalt-precorrin-6A reductase [Kiloniella antarctica]|uniref:Cobalt-precorrin-6A reductase n=1 Tax=Kiloniella antarctica TaxID=1550907 RepID=A0ABW5BDI9_9PROT
MSKKTILILGGTTEANNLAEFLAKDPHFDIITSRAGVTTKRKPVFGQERIGGFGGIEGLKEYLKKNQISAVIDATHPFAETMTAHAFKGCQDLYLPHIILNRSEWLETPVDNWIKVPNIETALDHIRNIKLPLHIFLTTGQKELQNFTAISQHHYVARMIETPDINPLPDNLKIRFERGPFSLKNEIKLLRNHSINMIVSKNSGGEATAAKLKAARICNIPVLMISRPALPPSSIVQSLGKVHDWLTSLNMTKPNR